MGANGTKTAHLKYVTYSGPKLRSLVINRKWNEIQGLKAGCWTLVVKFPSCCPSPWTARLITPNCGNCYKISSNKCFNNCRGGGGNSHFKAYRDMLPKWVTFLPKILRHGSHFDKKILGRESHFTKYCEKIVKSAVFEV